MTKIVQFSALLTPIMLCLLALMFVIFQLHSSGNRGRGQPMPVTRYRIKKHGISVSPERKQEIQKIYNERRLRLEKECKRLKDGGYLNISTADVATSKNHIILVPESKTSFCASRKSGSTFLARIAKSLTSYNLTTDPFISGAPLSWVNPLFKVQTTEDIVRELSSTTNVLFVRDPYSRLYSAWLDKFYSPNPFYWYNTATRTIETKARNTNPEVKCGTSVSFQEFIDGLDTANRNNQPINDHFLPSYKSCLVCHVDYTFIAKFEDYFTEILNVLSLNGVSHRIHTKDIENKANKEIIAKGITWLFRMRKNTGQCLSVKEGFEHFWNRLIARGILDKRSRFPFYNMSDETIMSLTREYVTNIMLQSYEEFDKYSRKNNREESLISALNNLPERTLKSVETMFDIDFKLFGYTRISQFHQDGKM